MISKKIILRFIILVTILFNYQHGFAQLRIMPLGDSITRGEGFGWPYTGYRDDLFTLLNNEGWDFDFVGSLSDGGGFDADHEGHGGSQADEIETNVNSWLNQEEPDIILLHIGTNDVSAEHSNSSTANEIESILTKIYNYSSTSIILLCKLIPRIGLYQENEDLNVLIEQVYQQKKNAGYNIYLVDQNAAFKENPNWDQDYLVDNVHPSNPGYTVMADEFLSVLKTVKFWLNVSINPPGAGSVQLNPDKTKFNYNESVLLTAHPSGGEEFEFWSGDIASDNENPKRTYMWRSRNITANFTGGETETVSTPNKPSGPSSGQKNSSLSYSTGGATSSLGHSVAYQFSWGDGQTSSWGGTTASHSYSSEGTFQIRARARCTTHTNIVSNWSSSKSVTIDSESEVVTTPDSPAGPGSGSVGQNLNYVTGGSTSSKGNEVEYQFSWGDGNSSGWGSASGSHSFSSSGTYQIRARARSKPNPDVVSGYSGSRNVTVGDVAGTHTLTVSVSPGGAGRVDKSPDKNEYEDNEIVSLRARATDDSYQFHHWSGHLSGNQNPKNITMNSDKNVTAHFTVETVSVPNPPDGPSEGIAGTDLEFTADGALSSFGHPVEYQFDFGDGNLSEWGSSIVNYAYSNIGSFEVQVRARCSSHIAIESDWSGKLDVSITGLTLTINVIPEAAGSVTINPNKDEYNYLESVNLNAIPVDGSFKFDFWDGDIQTSSNNPRGITMKRDRTITANFVSETVSVPDVPTGPIQGRKEQEITFSSAGAVSSFGHEVEYRFDWGDSTFSDWGLSSQSHTFQTNGSMEVKVRARCKEHNRVISDWSEALIVDIADFTLNITIEPAASGSVTKNPDKGKYDDGVIVELTPQGAPGYSFERWSGDLSGVNNPDTITMNNDKNITAHFLLTDEIVSIPTILTGPETGIMGRFLSFFTGGSTSNFGSDVEYRFDWGDSSNSVWGDSVRIHRFMSSGKKQVRARARSKSDTTILSEWSEIKAVNISSFTLSVFIDPEGTGEVTTNPDLSEYADSAMVELFVTPDSAYSFVHWSGEITGNQNPATIIITKNMNVTAHFETKSEEVTTPHTLVVPENPAIGDKLAFIAEGAINNYGFEIEYQFDWGDSTVSTWGTNERSHTYFTSDTFRVKARARSKVHPEVISNWSNPHDIILIGHKLTIVAEPDAKGLIATHPNKFMYSALDTVELWAVGVQGYRFDSWSGDITGNINPGRIAMNGDKKVFAHFVVKIETLRAPLSPQGPGNGYRGQLLNFSSNVQQNNFVGNVDYQFSWGDGYVSDWGDSTQSHSYFVSGSYPLISRARCLSDTTDLSPWSDTTGVIITGCKLTVNMHPGDGGVIVIKPNEDNYDYDTAVTLKAINYPKYEFAYWNENINDTASTKIIILRSDTTMNALFVPASNVENNLAGTPKDFVLRQNYPNPFNPQTKIEYQLAKNCFVNITIYNMQGQVIKVLLEEEKSAGWYSIKWDAKNQQGVKVPSGVYLYHIKTEYYEQVLKMILMK
ncbi:PKD domain-containing protein [candidate division KSB1 bacterium]|nr:PKD domain-containing protein [candidate division KSB1 bacterium]MBL7094332.1 PKD domain-containing protein [candidate division KSB1 bacterium]